MFRPGELHFFFAFQHAIGEALIDCDIYGPVAVSQILKGKHMKRGMEAYMILYLALNRMCLNECFEKYSNLFQKINPLIKHYVECFNDIDTSKDYLIQCQSLIDNLSDESFFELLHKFKEEMKGQPKFYLNFMKMYEILLLFTRATRQGLWDLHLASLELMIPLLMIYRTMLG